MAQCNKDGVFMAKERHDEIMEDEGKKLTPFFYRPYFCPVYGADRLMSTLFQLFMVIFAKIFF